jgi:adenosylcobinamide kinase/adenosylcobinamide-phosphate guanylyltransferase
MDHKLVLILGGARSGKSDYAQKLAQAYGGKVLFVATASGDDAEMRERIAQHQAERPSSWRTIEATLRVGEAIRKHWQGEKTILLDCITLLAGNVMGKMQEPYNYRNAQAAMDEELDLLCNTIRELDADWLVVSNEVGLGVVPPYPLGRTYRDVLGRANQRLAAEASEVMFMVAGLAMKMK